MQTDRINQQLFTASWPQTFANNVIHLLVLAFVFAALVWHWLGPVSGTYRFDRAAEIFVDEMARPGAWSLVGICVGIVLIIMPASRARFHASLVQSRRREHFLFGIVAVLSLAAFTAPGTLIDGAVMALLTIAATAVLGPRELVLRAFAAVAGYLLVGYAFTLLKAGVFWHRETWDLHLIGIDQALFGGLPHRWASSWSQASEKRLAIAQQIYLSLFPIMLAQLAVCALAGGRPLVRRYGLSLVIAYILGAAGYYLFPAWGPFVADGYAFPAEIWNPAKWYIADIQAFIVTNTVRIADGNGRFEELFPFAFVAAMPSLHMAIPALGFWLLLPYRRLLWITVPLCLLTAFAALATGMHYGVDLLAGIFLAWAASRLSMLCDRASQTAAAAG